MTIEEDVKRILDSDEEVLKMIKPNKKRFILINLLFSTCIMMLLPVGLFIFGLLGLTGAVSFVDESGARDYSAPIGFMCAGGAMFTFLFIGCIGLFVRYSKTYYFVTNKRLMIRSGFIGADYKSLPLSTVGMVDVRVDFLDKLVKNDTGTIIFGSASTPVVNQQNYIFAFRHLDKPYDTYKEIKEIISSKQNEKVS